MATLDGNVVTSFPAIRRLLATDGETLQHTQASTGTYATLPTAFTSYSALVLSVDQRVRVALADQAQGMTDLPLEPDGVLLLYNGAIGGAVPVALKNASGLAVHVVGAALNA